MQVEGAFLGADVSQKTVLLTSLKKEEGCSPNGPFNVGYFC